MQTYEVVTLIVIGFFLGKLESGTFAKIKQYFNSPATERVEFQWGMRQFFRLFSVSASERFYEAIAHCYQSGLISLLCGLGLIDIVRYEYYTDNGDRIMYRIKRYHGFRSYKSLLAMAKNSIEAVSKEVTNSDGFHQMFICGHNVVFDYWYE